MLAEILLKVAYMVHNIVPQHCIAHLRKVFHHYVLQVAELLVDIAVVLLELLY